MNNTMMNNTTTANINTTPANVTSQQDHTCYPRQEFRKNDTVSSGTTQNNNVPRLDVHTSGTVKTTASNDPPKQINMRVIERGNGITARNEKAVKPAVQQNEMQLYTPDDIMRIMRLSKSSVYKLFKSEDFPAIRVGSILRIERRTFERWLLSHTT